MVDSAIDRLARQQLARQQGVSQHSARQHSAAVDLARSSSAEAHLARREPQPHALVRRVPTRLRWKGLDVSDEFLRYAERVARGEDLPPFAGRVLAQPNPAFPWGDPMLHDAQPRKRGTHPVFWGAGLVVLGLLGWSIALKLQRAEPSARLETAVAPLAAPEASMPAPEPKPSAVSRDAVEASPIGEASEATQSASAEAIVPAAIVPAAVSPAGVSPAGVSPAGVSPAGVSPAGASPAAIAPATASPAGVSLAAIPPAGALPAAPLAPPRASSAPATKPSAAGSGSSVAVDLARPGTLARAVGAALAGSGPGRTSSPAPNATLREDDFGIMTAVGPAAPSSAPATTSASPAPASAAAKSSGNGGDVTRAAQAGGSGVRKEPGSESSAKGSLLVETPSF
jgi:hypothetical protein